MNKPKYSKALLLCIGTLVSAFIIFGIYTGIRGLVVERYISFSPPNAFVARGTEWVDFNLRLFDRSVIPQWVPWALLIFSIVIFVFYIGYLIRFRKYSSLKAIMTWSIVGLISVTLTFIASFMIIPGNIIWGIYTIATIPKVNEAKKLLSTESINTDYDSVLQSLLYTSKLQVYSDYGADGLLFAQLTQHSQGRKLTHFESFYLPIYFARHDISTGIVAADNAKLMMIGKNTFVFGQDMTKKDVESILKPVSEKLTISAYGKWIKNTSTLKNFSAVDNQEYATVHRDKIIANMKKPISENEASYAINKKIIEEYPSTVAELNEKYQQYVVEAEKEYDKGCVQEVKYNDCVDFKATNEINKKIIEEDQRIALNYFNDANKINAEIDILLKDQRKNLNQFLEDKDQLSLNQGLYSAASAFNNDTIYIRYYDGMLVANDLIRLTIHELLHIYSYYPEDVLPVAFDEGMTDYLATKALGFNEQDSVRVSGYPLEVQVIFALLEKVPEEDLLSSYFTKDEKKLQTLFETYFPKTDYKSFIREYNKIFDATYYVDGESNSFDIELFDHKKVRMMRKLLSLDEYHYEIFY